MIVGVDVSTTKLAFSGIASDGSVRAHAARIDGGEVGARRLSRIRAAAVHVAVARFPDAFAYCVEIPWAPKGQSSFSLLGAASVTLEGLQTARPDLVVMEITTGEWKAESVGNGGASKGDCMNHALALGLLVTGDQDLADATCIADAMTGRWHRASRGVSGAPE